MWPVRGMFVSSNGEAASVSRRLSAEIVARKQAVAKLLADLGFAPIVLGKLNAGRALLAKGGPLTLQNLINQG